MVTSKYLVILALAPDGCLAFYDGAGRKSRNRLILSPKPKKFRRSALSFALTLIFGLALFTGASFFRSEGEKYFSEEAKGGNSQNLALLGTVLSAAGRDYGGGDIVLASDGALLPEGDPSVSKKKSVERGSGEVSTYLVQEGDTVSEIAESFGISVNTLRWANDLKRVDQIRVGQTLVILPVSGIRHVVKTGDTLSKIAKMYKADLSEMVEFNDLDPDEPITVGEEVIVPGGQMSNPANSPTAADSGDYFVRPIKGGRKTQSLHGYNGVDLATFAGAPIYAAAAGEVLIAKNSGWNGGYGNYVVIKHPNKTQTLYSHASEVLVSVGDQVEQGEVIGSVGSTGKSSGPHLHFEVRGAKNPF